MFDKEQWPIIGDDEPGVLLDVVSNVVAVHPERKAAYSVCVRVPSGFFSYMRDVLKLDEDTAKARPVTFFLEESDRLWYLGIRYSVTEEVLDLWSYKDLPAWASKVRCL